MPLITHLAMGWLNVRSKPRSFLVGDAVYVKNFRVPAKWIPGVIVAQAGPLSYSVHLDTGVEVKRHVDHVRRQGPGQPVEMEETEGSKQSGGEGDCTDIVLPATSRQGNPAPETPTEQEIVDEGAEEAPEVQEENVAQRPELCRSSRPHHPPDRYGDHVWKLKGEQCSGRVTCHNDVIPWEQCTVPSPVYKADPLSRLRWSRARIPAGLEAELSYHICIVFMCVW